MMKPLLSVFIWLLVLVAVGESSDTVCYGDYGCFSSAPPFDCLYMELPQTPLEIATSFTLFTPEMQAGERLDPKRLARNSTAFRGDRKLVLIIHGFMQSGNVSWIRVMRDELLKREPMNVITVDWQSGADGLNLYHVAAGNTRVVGAQLAELITTIQRVFDFDLRRVHLIGHSLGAHVAGYAGERLSGKVGRITGLDPARPGFDVSHAAVRLDPSDALFVDVIHTDAGTNFLEGSLGLSRPCGNLDFYPNGGKSQPGCTYIRNVQDVLAKIRSMRNVPIAWLFACDHMKVINFFTESINSACANLAMPCDSWEDFKEARCFGCNGACARMGYDADQNAPNVTGKFFMLTTAEPPFCTPPYSFSVVLSGLKPGSSLFFVLTSKKIKITLIGSEGSVILPKPVYLDDLGSVESGRVSLIVPSKVNPGNLVKLVLQYIGQALFIDRVTVRDERRRTYTACFNKTIYSFYTYSTYRVPLTIGSDCK